jgi:hypothetical protein
MDEMEKTGPYGRMLHASSSRRSSGTHTDELIMTNHTDNSFPSVLQHVRRDLNVRLHMDVSDRSYAPA